MEKLRRKRKPLRGSFTRTVNLIESEIVKGAGYIRETITDSFIKLENLFEEIRNIDTSIIELLTDDVNYDEDTLCRESEEIETYSDTFISIKRRVSEVLNVDKCSSNGESKVSNCSRENSKRYKLPKLCIKPFDSQLINYLSFWSQFRKIHEDSELDNTDKFQYLMQSVQQGTPARRLLESYPMTNENYPKAVLALQDRFGDKDLLTEVYVREFLKLVINNVRANNKEKLPLSDLVIKIEAHLRSLESMGLNLENNSAWLFPLIE